MKERQVIWKTVYNIPLKLKTHVFAGYLLAKILMKNVSEAQNLSRVDFTREIVTRQSRKSLSKILCFQYFSLTHFREKSLVASFSQKCL